MSSDHGWRARTSQRVMVDTRSVRVGLVAEETDQVVTLRTITSGAEWDCPATAARPATPDEVAAALAEE